MCYFVVHVYYCLRWLARQEVGVHVQWVYMCTQFLTRQPPQISRPDVHRSTSQILFDMMGRLTWPGRWTINFGAGEELRRSWGGAGFNGWAWVLEALGVCYFVTCILLHCGGVSGSRYTCVHQLPDFPPQRSRIDVHRSTSQILWFLVALGICFLVTYRYIFACKHQQVQWILTMARKPIQNQ